MGGIGSGRRYQGGKATTDEYRALDVRQFQRAGRLTPGQSFGWGWSRNGEVVAQIDVQTAASGLILNYRYRLGGGEWQAIEHAVSLNYSDCANIGGRRAWFVCPAQGCGRRVALLYGGAGIFACRHCYRLAYASQREATDNRVARRVNAIRRRLGWQEGILNPRGWKKPKGMHARTFEHLACRHDALIEVALAGLSSRIDRMRGRLGGIQDDLCGGR
ncbi:MAG TPA: hypothetical protein PLS93_10045 [Accumulibacter sp.]|nr:hypothetical protein [Accumulibacter sp.]